MVTGDIKFRDKDGNLVTLSLDEVLTIENVDGTVVVNIIEISHVAIQVCQEDAQRVFAAISKEEDH
jgi:hypothetical protein